MDNETFPPSQSVDLWFYYVWNNNVNDSVHFVSTKTIKEVELMIWKAQKWSMTPWKTNRQRDVHLTKSSPAFLEIFYLENLAFEEISWRI